jgi:hypothetical protein
MARQRFIHPGIWSDPVFGTLTDSEQVFYIGLFSNADDEGRILAGPSYLKSIIWPHRDVSAKQVQRVRDRVVAAFDAITLYTVRGVDYIEITNWSEYQKPKYPTPSKLPAKDAVDTPKLPPILREASPNPPGSLPPRARADLGLGLGKGLGEEANASSAQPPSARTRDDLWDALEAECGPAVTASERSRRNRYRKELNAAGATAGEIHRRATLLRTRWPDIDLTDNSLVKNWSKADLPLPDKDNGKLGGNEITAMFGGSYADNGDIIEAPHYEEIA